MSTISIIVPVYEVEKYLKRCVDSILCQTFCDIEVILVDDGSSDNCGFICDEYAKQDKRVKVIHKQNGGLSSARNAGLDIATGDYIGFVDSDDWIHPQMYEYLYNCALKYNLDIMTCCFEKTELCNLENCSMHNDFCVAEQYNSKEFLDTLNLDKFYQFSPSVCSKLYKKEIFKDLRFIEGKIFEDTIIMIPTLLRAHKIGYTDKILYYYFSNRQGSIMNRNFGPKYFTNCIQHVYLSLRNSKSIDASYIFEKHYLHELLKTYKRVVLECPVYKKEFNDFLTENPKITFRDIFNNNQLCNMEKLVFSLFKINKILSLKIYNKYFY